ncbi:polysaccharide deacetylase family protein [Massilia sp. R2A-15]|uniref:polysaccharide deacetylase family protein n=1 Tax=Massilia sp. R2A-15 TaxID=3064278 RepID=UPI0027350207|nr:polysaccharide deacetylase family protein [Massilia sp. R2A-15]WLI88916.1 polysaccharide deacetylase family protein [Massilia sp. R2A-15]
MLRFASHTRAQLSAGDRPILLVVVDTEEEFDWQKPFNRSSTGTTSISDQPTLHDRVYDRLGIVPTYMVDWPVATTAASVAVLRALTDQKRCEIGAHLHPWVTPPHDEQVTAFNSFAGNLPRALEQEKLQRLTVAISDAFGRAPIAFKAGRYGLGAHTADMLAMLGYQIDASVVPYTSFRADDGPDFSAFGHDPYWFKAGGRDLLELPVTGGYCGWLAQAGPPVYQLAQHRLAKAARLGGILARTRAVERIRLSPEGANLDEMKRLSRALVRGGTKILTMTYHSPSLAVGHTPYVRSQGDLRAFIQTINDYCTFFEAEIGGVFMSLSEVYQKLHAQRAAPC